MPNGDASNAPALAQQKHANNHCTFYEARYQLAGFPGFLIIESKLHSQRTIKGNAMRTAPLVPRINRAKAEKLLADFLWSVEEVNSHPDLLHWVTEVRVFGSYLTNSEDLGDIEIAIKTERRPVSGTDHDIAFYLNRMVARLLKGGSRYISLHGVEELDERFDFGGKTVYTFAPPQLT